MRSLVTTINDVMADDFSQGMQIGANLWDRAQTQRRMVDQLNMQVADQVMRQKAADIQNQMQQFNLRDALEEKTNQEADLPMFYDYQKQVSAFLNNPSAEAPMPALPQFKSRTYRMEAEKTAGDLRDVSVRKAAMQNQQQTKQLLAQANNAQHSRFNKLVEEATATGDSALMEAVHRHSETAILPNGMVNPAAVKGLEDALIPFRKKEFDAKRLKEDIYTKGGVGQVRIDNLKNKAIENYRNMFGDPTPADELSLETALQSNTYKPPTGEVAKSLIGDRVVALNADDTIRMVDEFDKKYPGKLKNYIGMIDQPLTKLKTQLVKADSKEMEDFIRLSQKYQTVFNKEALRNSGKAVTGTELERNIAAVGSPRSENFVENMKNFTRQMAFDLYNNVNTLKTSTLLSPEDVKTAERMRSKYLPEAAPLVRPRRSSPGTDFLNEDEVPADLPIGTEITIRGRRAIIR